MESKHFGPFVEKKYSPFFPLRLLTFVVSDQGVWQMEGQQPGSGAERFLGVSVAPDARVHQEHPSAGPQAHHPDDH